MVALFEHGVHGQFAAPIVRDVMKAYFDKKTRLAQLKQQQDEMAARMSGLSALGLPGIAQPLAGQTSAGSEAVQTKPQPVDAVFSKRTLLQAPGTTRSPAAPAVQGEALQTQGLRFPSPAVSLPPFRTIEMSRYLSLRDIDWTLLIIVILLCASACCRSTAPPSTLLAQRLVEADRLRHRRAGLDLDGAGRGLPHSDALRPHAVRGLGGWRCWALLLLGNRFSVRNAGFRSPAGFHLQVSEFVKLVIILLVARYLTDLKAG